MVAVSGTVGGTRIVAMNDNDQIIVEDDTAGRSPSAPGRFPFTLAAPEAVDYSPELFPGTFEALSRILVLPWSERYESKHVEHIAETIRNSVSQLVS